MTMAVQGEWSVHKHHKFKNLHKVLPRVTQ